MSRSTNAPEPAARLTVRDDSSDAGVVAPAGRPENLVCLRGGRHPRPGEEAAQPLTRFEAAIVAWEVYGTDSPAVVELLLLAHNPDADTSKRYAANQALTWFDPGVDLPEVRLPEPAVVRAFRWAVYAYDIEERKKAANALLFHLEEWGA